MPTIYHHTRFEMVGTLASHCERNALVAGRATLALPTLPTAANSPPP